MTRDERSAESGEAKARAIRSILGRVTIEEGSMGAGFVLVAESGRLGPIPVASVHLPLKTKEESRAVAEFFAAKWNEGMR